jgi:hypothetical protein
VLLADTVTPELIVACTAELSSQPAATARERKFAFVVLLLIAKAKTLDVP